MTDLDLNKGDLSLAEKIAAGKETPDARVAKKATTSGGATRQRNSTARKVAASKDDQLTQRLLTALDKIADQLEAREDHELATAIREEREPMVRSVVSLTKGITFLRRPLVVAVSLLEPVLAFWRIGRILGGRFITRRQRMVAERQAAMQEHEPVNNGQSGAVPV